MQASPPFRFIQHPDGATTVELTVDDAGVSRATIIPMTVRIGTATVRVDGIGGVATDDAHRNRGYSRQVLEFAVEYMKQGDAPLTTLYGIQHFYPKFGYATVGGEAIVRLLSLAEDSDLPAGCCSRTGRPSDLPRLKTLYDDGTRDAVGPVIRGDEGIGWQQMETSLRGNAEGCIVVTDEADEVIAYAWRAPECWWMKQWSRRDPEIFKIGEAFAISPRAADGLLAACRGWAARHDMAMAELAIPRIGALGMSAALQSTIIGSLHYRDAQFMGRSTGVHDLMTALRPELERRWRGVRGEWRGVLEFRTGEDAVSLVIGVNDVTVVPDGDAGTSAESLVIDTTPGNVARLAFGSFDPSELLARSGTSPDAIDVLAILFPQRNPYIYPADRF